MRIKAILIASVLLMASPVLAEETEAEWMSREVDSDLFPDTIGECLY